MYIHVFIRQTNGYQQEIMPWIKSVEYFPDICHNSIKLYIKSKQLFLDCIANINICQKNER